MSVLSAVKEVFPVLRTTHESIIAAVEGKEASFESSSLGNLTAEQIDHGFTVARTRKMHTDRLALVPGLKKDAVALGNRLSDLVRQVEEEPPQTKAEYAALVDEIADVRGQLRAVRDKKSDIENAASFYLENTADQSYRSATVASAAKVDVLKDQLSKLAMTKAIAQELADCRVVVDTFPALIDAAAAIATSKKGTAEERLEARIDCGKMTATLMQAREKLAMFADREAKCAKLEKEIAAAEREKEKHSNAWRDWKNFDLNYTGPKRLPLDTYTRPRYQ